MTKKTGVGLKKSKGGLIRASVGVEDGIIRDLDITGDFFLMPEEAIFIIINELKNTELLRGSIIEKIRAVYAREKIQSPGTVPEDFAESIMKAAGCE